jgi:hypothetical protein
MSIWSSLATWAKSGAPSSSSVLNTGLTMLTNYQNRQNALKDQQRLNLYNSPQQQMQRFKEAGLNPNLIYKQTNEGAPVRSTDYVAPQINETQLDVLGKSNNIQVQKMNMESMRLRNENQELQNDILRSQIPDLKEKIGIQNRVGNATYDKLVEATNLLRQQRSQNDTINPLLVKKEEKNLKILDNQIYALSLNNQFKALSNPIQIEIAKLTRDNLEKTGKGIDLTNDLKEFEKRMRNSLDNLGIGTGLAQDIIKILMSKIF